MNRSTLALAAALAIPCAAGARPQEHLRVEAATAAPVYVGGRLLAELPGRIRLGSSVGVLPRPYVDGINEIAVATGGYDDDVAEVIEETLATSVVWRTHLGWRPFTQAGFYFEAGYGLVTLGGGTSEAELVAMALGLDVPDFFLADRYEVKATLHMFDAEVGWEWWVEDRISFRLGLGVASTLDASAAVDPAGGLPFLADAGAQLAEEELEEIIERYVHTPTLSMAVGVRLF